MKQWFRRVRANYYYLRKPLWNFLPLLVLLIAVLFGGAYAFHHLYAQESLTYLRALYITYCLIFMEHIIPFPEHWALQAFYFGLPILGLVVILDGIVRFGYYVLRRDENSAEWVRAMAKAHRDHVILCGLGRVGLRVLEQLIQLGEDVVVLEKDRDNQNLAFARKHGIPVMCGSGREEGILDDLNVSDAKSIILATNDDLANLEMALDARKARPEIRVVLRMFDQELASKIRESFDLQLAFSTAAQAAPLFATSSSDGSITNSFYVDDQLLVVAKLTVNAETRLAGKKIRDLGAKHRLFFLSHQRGETQTHFPLGETELQSGDRITIQTAPDTLKLLHKWNGDRHPG
jgi:voltage-gated potassium channel